MFVYSATNDSNIYINFFRRKAKRKNEVFQVIERSLSKKLNEYVVYIQLDRMYENNLGFNLIIHR